MIVVAGGAGVGAFIAWYLQRRTPPSIEQEKIIQEIIKEWYSNNYLNAHLKIWKDIENRGNSEDIIDSYWRTLSSKKFPEKYLEESRRDLIEQIEYFSKKLHLKKRNKDEIESRIKTIRNIADVEYYTGVRHVLPALVDIAAKVAMDSSVKPTRSDDANDNYKVMLDTSLKNLKKLMIFYRIRENSRVCEILIRANLNEKLYNLGPTTTGGGQSTREI